MLKIPSSRLTLKQEDLSQYEKVKASWSVKNKSQATGTSNATHGQMHASQKDARRVRIGLDNQMS
jgi:hypothetical protein